MLKEKETEGTHPGAAASPLASKSKTQAPERANGNRKEREKERKIMRKKEAREEKRRAQRKDKRETRERSHGHIPYRKIELTHMSLTTIKRS